MRILVHDFAGHAFIAALSRKLAARGHNVLHLYFRGAQSPQGGLPRRCGDPPGLTLEALSLDRPWHKYSYLRRRSHEIEYGRRLADRAELFEPEVILSAQTPLDAQSVLYRRFEGRPVRRVFWVQDLIGVAVTRLLGDRWLGLGKLAGLHYERKEHRLLRSSDLVIGITEDFLSSFGNAGVAPERVATVPNWAPLEELPRAPKDNAWAREQGLWPRGGPLFLYSGTLGLKHDPSVLLALAAAIETEGGELAVVSEGLGARWLEERKRADGIDNLTLLPFQPFDRLPEVLASADVLVALLEPAAGVFSVPSKVLSYFCAGRPVLLSVPPENLAAKTVLRAGAGMIVAPGDAGALSDAARALAADPRQREEFGNAGRLFAEDNFDLDRIADRFEGLLAPAPS